MKPPIKFAWSVLIIVCVGLLIMSCGRATEVISSPVATEPAASTEVPPATQAESEPRQGGTVTVAFSAGWDILDPAATAFAIAHNIMWWMYDPILHQDPDTGEIVPGLAESFEISDDNREITLHLREGVNFHDGTPFNAEALKFSLDRIQDPELNSPWAQSISGPVETIEVIDEFTLVITLREPFAPFLDSLTKISLAPVSPAAVEELGNDGFAENPVGTGPFMFEEEVPNERIVLVRNPDYNWAPDFYEHQGPAYLDEIVVLNVEEDSTRMAMGEAGELDVIYSPDNRRIDLFVNDLGFQVFYGTRNGLSQVMVLTTSRPPFDDPQVRLAIHYALDKERGLRDAYENVGTLSHSVLTPGIFGYWEGSEEMAPKYDQEMARQLLAEAGWEDTNGDGILEKDGEEFRITYGSLPGLQTETLAQIWQANLRDVGIEMEIEVEEQAAWLDHIREGKWNSAHMGLIGTDPDVLWLGLHSESIENAWNTPDYNNPEMDALLEAGRVTVDPEERAQIYQEVQELALEDTPYVPYRVDQRPYLVSGRVEGFKVNNEAFFQFYDAWINE